MPVKKNPANKSPKSKKPAGKKNPRKILKKDIKKAVDQIPEFLFTKVEASTPEENNSVPAPSVTPESQEKFAPPPKQFSKATISNYASYQKKRLILWLVIAIFTGTILGLWIWNMTTLWQDARGQKSPEQSLWQEAKNSLGNLQTLEDDFTPALREAQVKDALKNQIEQELTKTKIKNVLIENMTTSSTSNASTTTTNNF